ncbi:YjbH domain-containing protein [Escherichia coli]|nr:YjbH domain-containing protein [Escherichia coli]EED1454307.1 YjbH domain-containing protein [Escherichia coli]EED1644613.1 YjbH domain-containing protein [Escherichia coli]EEV8089326.1 YjbH domain-containing protein [Escherichia coli]EEV9587617.1 YjbH domain-containing protein [Escherichia coli]
MKKRHLLSLLALGISTACYGETYPAPIGPSQSDFGGVGLLQTPTARMAREGELSLNYRDNDQYRYYSASVQLFPWLETTLRYTDVRTRQYSSVEAFSGDQTYKDKAFDLKLRLWEESYWLPQVAVGARDIGGTGLFDAEYLVASKAWGPFDFTLGLGWGYLGTSGNVNNLQANYFQHLGNGFYGQVYGGYLETMFGGAGAEVLYRPLDSNWAFGLDANYVKQRDWRSAKDMMKFTDYSVKTGHLTAYWTPSFAQDVLVKASVGQYLAGDKGGTLEIAKRFDSGVVVGGYATITNVSKEEYGEGDFTKGVYVSVPLDLFSSGPTRSRAAIGWTPLTRDGGQQLGRKFQLYDMTSDRSVNFR